MKHKKVDQNTKTYLVNQQIKPPNKKILLIDENNINCGNVNISEALEKAKNAGLDLVQVYRNKTDITCKIIDFSKFKYDLSKQEKLNKKKQKESRIKIKEIRLRPSTDKHDLIVKARQAEEFLMKNHHIKISIQFKGRELSHKEIGKETLKTFLSMITCGVKEITPRSISGKTLSMIIAKS